MEGWKHTGPWGRDTGMMEGWNIGILGKENWNIGILEYWNVGIMEKWDNMKETAERFKHGTLEGWNDGPMDFY